MVLKNTRITLLSSQMIFEVVVLYVCNSAQSKHTQRSLLHGFLVSGEFHKRYQAKSDGERVDGSYDMKDDQRFLRGEDKQSDKTEEGTNKTTQQV